jgi:hypothetical protein
MPASLSSRSPRETAERLLVVAAVSAVASGMDRREIVDWLTQQTLWPKASPAERAFLSDEHPAEKTSIHFSWQMEAVYVLGWALKLLPRLDPPTAQASIGDVLEQLPGPGDAIDRFVTSCALRSAAEIHAAAESALNAHAHCRSARSRGVPEPHGYDIEVAQERHRTLNWLIRYEEAAWDDVATDT